MVVLPGYCALAAGESVALQVDLGEAVLFSAQTGQNLAFPAPTAATH
jgi:hypothetical protein